MGISISISDITPLARASAAFRQHYGSEPSVFARAPGRVNLIGEHTDYNDGFALPCAIDRETVIVAAPRTDQIVQVFACDAVYQTPQTNPTPQTDSFSLNGAIPIAASPHWANYVRGVLAALREGGWVSSGANLVIAGNVPQGAGLSSSASLEIAIAQTFKQIEGWTINGVDMARAGQRAEHEYAGCRCGIMDQLVSALGQADHALLLDCRDLSTRAVPLPSDMAVVVIDSKIQRGLVESEYNLRRQQCEEAAQFFGVAALRDVSLARWQTQSQQMTPLLARRSRHIVSENARTVAAADALASGDLRTMGELMAQSHVSMRDDFEITIPPIDNLVSLVKNIIGAEGGVRMTGGGFGGCVVALVQTALVPQIQSAVAAQYRSPEGYPAVVYVCRASAGASKI